MRYLRHFESESNVNELKSLVEDYLTNLIDIGLKIRVTTSANNSQYTLVINGNFNSADIEVEDRGKDKDWPYAEYIYGKIGDYIVSYYPEDDYLVIHSKQESSASLEEGKKIHPNQIHPHELYIGTKVEMEHTDDIEEAEKIALDHLSENPFYYTALKLSGIDAGHDRVSTKKRTDIGEEVGKNNFVDKGNQMKTPKGVEAVKASANKAKPETNKTVKGVKELGHVAKSVRGVKKMDPTGSKMKKINVKESLKTLIKGMVLEILNEDKK
jgi:sorbitol-specific phosphotransferase system component IIA